MNEQEALWAGQFGNDYTNRLASKEWIESNVSFFADALMKAKGIKTIMEIGCNRGLNLAALEYLDPSTIKTGLDINAGALKEMTVMFDDLKLDIPYLHCSPIAEFETVHVYDLVISKGVLIHINPEQLATVYQKIYDLSSKYILIAEYYNPVPVEVVYRGMTGKLWKRDFAGEMIDKFGLKLIDYGFVYHRDVAPQDDINWFLLSKEK